MNAIQDTMECDVVINVRQSGHKFSMYEFFKKGLVYPTPPANHWLVFNPMTVEDINHLNLIGRSHGLSECLRFNVLTDFVDNGCFLTVLFIH